MNDLVHTLLKDLPLLFVRVVTIDKGSMMIFER